MPLSIKQQAPDFTLYDSEKNKITLGDYAGAKNVLLLFFPLAFTSTCTKELCEVRDNISTYSDENVQILGISVDSVYVLAKYKMEQDLNYPLLSDFNKEVSGKYEVLYESFSTLQMKGVSKRAAFLISKEGIVEYMEVLENAGDIPDFQAIMGEIRRLKGNKRFS